MAEFLYTAIDSTGKKIEGKRNAQKKEEVMEFLNAKSLTVISIRESFGVDLKKIGSIEIGGQSLGERVIIAKQLSTMVSAGIPILQAIGILVEQTTKPSLKEKFQNVYKNIESGLSLSKSFERAGGLFTEVQINLIAAGEKSGNLNDMLNKVAEDLEKSKNMRGKILGALIYPVIIFVVLIIVVGVMIVFMVPQVSELYASFGQPELPLVTRILVRISSLIGNPTFIIGLLIIIASLFLSYRAYTDKPERRIPFDKIKIKIPVFGPLLKKIQLAEFCRIMSMLISSGIPIIEALEIVAKAMPLTLYETILNKAKEDVTKGTSISVSIAKNNYKDTFPPILLKIIATGEESGKLDKVLEDMYLYYNNEVEQITGNLTKLLEPFILVLVGGMVAFLAIAIYYPIYQVGNFIN